MTQIYELLKQKYGLTEDYAVLTPEEEIKKISIYQNPKTPNHIKKQIMEEFWNNHKSAIIKEAIKYYSLYYRKTQGSVSVDIDDLIQKGAMALTHCMNIFNRKKKKKTKKVKSETTKSKKTKGSIKKKPIARFSTLLHWWLRPFILNKINQENYMIYVPHYKGSKNKSILVGSLDRAISDDTDKTRLEYIKSTDPNPGQIAEQSLFWDKVKEKLSPEEYDILIHWLSYKNYFKSSKELYEHYNLTPSRFKSKINEILKKLKKYKEEFQE